MMKLSKRIQSTIAMQETGLVPVFYNADIEICKRVVDACYAGGVRVFEFTNRGDFAHEVFAELSKHVMANYKDLYLGVGSVVDAPTAALYIQMGAAFVVSPILNAEMAKVCNRRKVGWSPGCGSLSEISYAEELGAEIVKIFPGSQVGGPGFVKAVAGPCPWSNIMPTGGVNPDKENLKLWFEAGVACVGIGSKLFPNEIIQQKKYNEITANVADVISIIKELR